MFRNHMDRRQVCAQVLQSSLLPQAIGFLYPGIKDAHWLPQATDFAATSDWKEATAILPHKRLGLEMLHLPRKNSNHPWQ